MAATSTAKKSKSAKMPIEDYDRLSVKAILPHLATLSGPELQVVVAHEKAGKNRVTLLQAVRKIELAREAAAHRSAPPSHLTMVEDETVEDEAEEFAAEQAELEQDEDVWAAADQDEAPWDDADQDEAAWDEAIEAEAEPIVVLEPTPAPAKTKRQRIGGVARPAASRPAAPRPAAPRPAAPRSAAPRPAAPRPAAPRPAAPRPAASHPAASHPAASHPAASHPAASRPSVPEVAPTPTTSTSSEPEPVVEKKARSRGAVKAATWEEEPKLQLPRRMTSSYEFDFEPPVVALVPDIPEAPTATPDATFTPRASGPARVRRKFEGAALVMAAVLAVLLGLAIGTILARSGSVSTQSTPPAAATQAASVPAGG